MKIYTITFATTLNVGAELQMYALSQFLLEQGNNVQVVNYAPSWLRKQRQMLYPLCHCKTVFDIVKQLILLPNRISQIKKYTRFDHRYVCKTIECRTEEAVCALPAPDCWITGSDQVWNFDFVGDDNVFFLNIPVYGKKMSYAASAGKDIFMSCEEKILIKKIQSLSTVSVREDALKEILDKNGIYNVFHVLDPVFLLNSNRYLELAEEPKIKNYVFVYSTERDYRLIKLARRLADKYNLVVIEMNRRVRQPGVDIALPYLSPEEFIGYIHCARYIVTNSFHCTAFSIIFRKQIFTVPLFELNSRIHSLLQIIGWQQKAVVLDVDQQDLEIPLDYTSVEQVLNENIERSKQYLCSALGEG